MVRRLPAPQMVTLRSGAQVTIRPATMDDAAETLSLKLSLLREGVADALLPEECNFDIQQEQLWINQFLVNRLGLMLVAEADGNILGFIYFSAVDAFRCRHTGEFALGMYETWRKQGLGKVMIEALMAWIKQQPEIEKLCARIYDINPAALAVAEKMGFVEEGRLKNHLRIAHGKYSDVVLVAKFLK